MGRFFICQKLEQIYQKSCVGDTSFCFQQQNKGINICHYMLASQYKSGEIQRSYYTIAVFPDLKDISFIDIVFKGTFVKNWN